MNLINKIFREAIENNGEVELCVRITRNDKVGEVYEKIEKLLSIFPPDTIQVVPIRQLTSKEEQAIFEIAMSDYEDEEGSLVEIVKEAFNSL